MIKFLQILFVLLLVFPIVSFGQKVNTSIKNEIRFYEKKIVNNRYLANDSILHFAQKQLNLAEETKDSIEIGRAYLSLGIANNIAENNDNDLQYLFKARELFKSFKSDSLHAITTLELISFYKEARSVYFSPDTLLFGLKKYFRLIKAQEPLARTYLEIGLDYRNSYRKVEIRDSIPYYYNKSKNIAESIDNMHLYYAAINNIADFYFLKPQINLDTVIQLSNQIIDSRRADKKNRTIAYLNKSLALNQLNDTAYFYNLKMGFDLSKEVPPSRLRAIAAEMLYEYYKKNDNFEQALFYYQLSQEKRKNIKGYYQNMLFENLGKEVIIKEQQGKIIKNNLNKQLNYIYLLVAVLLFLMLYSIVIIKKNKIIKQKNIEIKRKKENIEWLLKEVHHRVKNNLQMIVGLLDLHQSSVKNEDIALVLNDVGSRVKSVALIHQNLYRGDTDMVTIGFQQYLEELIDNLMYSFNMLQKIDVDLDIDELEIPFDKAVIFGLLITELITNVLKHAFPNKKNRKLTIKLKHAKNDESIFVLIKDNGIGFPTNFNEDADSFGLDLIKTLVKDLNGEIKFENNDGAEVSISLSKII